ncbi:hypothetical protein ATY41_12005 [Leifsonia xyli subsp. xyli]|uniref:Dolichyl-phosphate mannose synthase n=2 Tax=Leifsonia xyli subsp. xyli TaxID=59736 RepID=Q6AH85_LEIXX|nr:glycosyltransferase [Leifsonia xyli]AAT88260.1 dolichyl-phosphate mannose synthase [Leifsonia xyli subsp. xyli str. CTCB07]ODA89880.1 hypothetical protein ATY41_12005 [Leifsonia xyli subsp. xyli]
MKTIIAIPAYNCAPQLPRVLAALDAGRAASVQEVWVVDNGSTDGTAEVAVEHAANWGNLRVFRNRRNVNLGGTYKTVFLKAREARATHVVILHGDDQARAEEAYDLIAYAAAGGPQTVLGSRFGRGSRLHGYDLKRIFGNRVLNAIYSVCTFRALTDLGSGLNLFALADLDPRSYLRFGDRLSFNYELILDLIRRRVDFRYEPITWREEDQVSNARNVRVFSEGLGILARWRFRHDPWGPVAPASDYELGSTGMTEPLQIVLPMAELGQRFRATSETQPKPLIEVDGGPMFRKALDSLTAAGIRGDVTAIIRAELQRDHGLGTALRAASPDLRVVELAAPTGGAAETVLAAPLDPERPLLIMDCDIAFESPGYASELARATAGGADGVLLSFPSSDPRYSFAATDDNGRVVRTAEKVAISRNALMGVYFFRRAGEFQECAREVVEAAQAGDVTESYLSLVYNRMLSRGSTVRLARGTFYCFGTPEELASYRETGLPVG